MINQQASTYQINYDKNLDKTALSKIGEITFDSKVLNMMILYTKYKIDYLHEIKGVNKVLPLNSSMHKN